MIGRRVLHYDILEKLGEGGMGVVFRAHDTRLDREVAIKLLSDRFTGEESGRARFDVEARAAARLNHPNIAVIHAFEHVEDLSFIVMELVRGRELRKLIAEGILDVATALDFALQIADGLRAAHSKGIVHRDIKPSNILISREGTAKITDFGLARIDADSELTKSGTTIGTAAYMSPEQLRGERLDQRTDIWSFGIVLFEMLSGARPFSGTHASALMHAILHGQPPPLAVDSVALRRVVAQTLEKNAASRYQTMADVVAALESCRDEISGGAQRSSRPGEGAAVRPRLAVLPFASIRSDPDRDFLGFALADQIIGALSYVKGIVVRPSSAIRRYQKQSIDALTAGQELEVEFILTGHYLEEGRAIRLNIELVDTRSNEMVWRESIRGDSDNVFELQDTASEKVLQGLEVRFSHEERGRMQADVPAVPAAYEYYLRAVSYPVTLDDNRLAVEMLEEAIRLDPHYAPAYSELGYRLKQIASFAMLDKEEWHRADEVLLEALSLNENLLGALWHLAFAFVDRGDPERALELINRMFQVAPGNAEAHFALSYLYRYTGLLDESALEVERALAIDAKNPRFRSAGFTYVYMGDYEKAYAAFELDRSGTFGIAWRGVALFLLGERDRAVECFDRAVAMEPEGFLGLRHAGISEFIKGDNEAGLGFLRRLENALPPHCDAEHWYLVANVFGLLGDRDACVRCLRRAVEEGFFNHPAMSRDPLLDSLREDAEFQEVLGLAKTKCEAFRESVLLAQGLTVTRPREDS